MWWGDQLREMTDSTHNLHQPDVLRATLARDSYLLLRGVIPPELVHGARAVVTSALHKQWQCIDTSQHPHTYAAIPPPSTTATSHTSNVLLTGYQPVTHHPTTLALLHSHHLAALVTTLTNQPVSTFDTKWVRVMSTTHYTDEHTDYYRFQRNASGMLTVWVPLGDYAKEQGVLAVGVGSHRMVEAEEREEADRRRRWEEDGGREEKEGGGGGGGEEEKEGGGGGKEEEKAELPKGYAACADTLPWVTTDVQVGDVIIFDIRTVHASTANEGNVYRLSMDTRWQPTHLVPAEHKNSFRQFTV